MVHALERIHTALAPSGLLIDVRPISARWPLDIVAGGRSQRVGRVDDTPGRPDDRAADTAMRSAVRRRTFRQVAGARFPFEFLWDSVTAMEEYVRVKWEGCVALPPLLVERALRLEQSARGECEARITLRMILNVYKRLGPGCS